MAIEAELHDGRILEFPDGTDPAVIQATVKRVLAGSAPETSFFGQVGEAFKGVIPGAVGLVEQAAIGASALLPEEQERAARETIAQVAGATKAPFAPAPGYEGTVGRKFGEAFGSFLPMLPLGALGLAGKTAAVGLGVGAGAGEARTRAETEGATEEQRATATALGTLPGALEVFAPFRILKRVPEGEVLTAVDRVKRIALASGEEAAQEAASGLAQNMIARGVYKPEQELIEGLGEQAAYGGAVGGLAQGLLDLALGRRARGAGAGEPVPPEGQTEIDVVKAKREAERQAAEAAKAAKEAPPEIPPLPETYAELVRYSEEVKRLPKSKERNEALKAASEKRKAIVIAEVNANRLSAERAKQFLTAEEAEQAEVVRREELAPPTAPTTETPTAEAPAGKAAAPPVEEPKVRKVGAPAPLPDVLDSATIKTIGFTRGKVHDALVGKSVTDPEVRRILEEAKSRTPSEKTGNKIDAFLARLPEPTPTPPVAAEPAPTVPVSTSSRENYWRPNPTEPENENSWQDTFGQLHYDVSYALPGGGRVKDVVEAPQSDEIRLIFENSKGEEKVIAAYVARGKKPYWYGVGDRSEAQIEAGLGKELYSAIGDKPLETEADFAALVAKLRGILSKPTETPSAVQPDEQPSGAGVPVAGGPAAVTPTEGAGAPEPSGVVPPVEDAGQPAGGEAGEPPSVAPSAIVETMSPAVRTGTFKFLHGTDQPNLQRFEPKYEGTRYDGDGGTFGQDGVYLDNTGAWTSGRMAGMWTPEVYETFANFKKAFVISPSTLDQLINELPGPPPRNVWGGEDIAKILKSKGYDGIIVEGFGSEAGLDPYNPDADPVARNKLVAAKIGLEITQDQVFAFYPENVKVGKKLKGSPQAQAPAPATYVAPVSQGAAARAKRGVRREAPALDTEDDIDRALATGLIDEETADRARAELVEFEAPATAMGQAFQKQIDEIRAKMDALRLKGGRIPAPKSKARKEFDALQEQLNALLPKETGTLTERLEKARESAVVTSSNVVKEADKLEKRAADLEEKEGRVTPEVAGLRSQAASLREASAPVIDIPSVRAALKNRSPKMLRAVLAYIGVDTDGTYLPTTYSAGEAAELVGLKRSSGSEVTRIADALGVTSDVISRFQASQTGRVGVAKDVSEASLSGISVENPKAGVLYEAPKKPAKTEEEYDALVAKEEETRKEFESGKYEEGTKEFDKARKAHADAEKALKAAQPIVQDFLRPALTKLGQIDFTKLSIGRTKNRETKKYEDGLAEIYARASFYPAKDNVEVMKALGAEIEARRKADRNGTDAAINRAYGKVVKEQEAKAEEEVETTEEVDEETEAESDTRRLADEDAGDDATFSTAAEKLVYRTIPRIPLIQGVISDAQLRKLVADIERALGGSVDITILDDVTDFDNKQAPGSRAGALRGGKIYLFRSGIADGVEGQKTIFHEVFHKGLANLLSPAEYRALMTKFYNQSAAVRQAADAYLASAAGKKDTEELTKEEARVLAVEEALAEMAEATKLTGSTLRQLGNFFARLADRFNMPGLARAIRTMGLDPLQAFIRDAIQAGIKPSTATGPARYRSLVGEKEERTLGDKLDAKFGGNKALGFRAQAMDLLAGVDYIFTKAYGNRIRDNRGDYNPVFLMSRALDAPRFASEVKEYGTMRRDPTGLLSIEKLNYKGEDISYKQVLKDIAAEAKARKVNPETFLKQVGESLAAHREYELMNDPQVEKDIDFFLTPEQAKAAEDAFQADAFVKGVSEKLDQIRFAMIDAMVDAGRITPAKAKEWKEATGYIPFSRVDEFDKFAQRPDAPSNVKLAAFKQIKAYKGSKERQTQNPVENFSKLMDWMVSESMKADAVGNALTEMELLGYAQFVPNREAIDNNKQGALVDTYVKGQKKTFYVPDPANLTAFVGAPTNNIPSFVKGAQKFSQFLRIGVTATPPFAIKQVLDDITRAYVHSGVKNPAVMLPRILLNFPRNWWNEIKGAQSAGVRELAKSGVVPAYDTVIGGNVKNVLEETGLAPRSVGKAILRIMEAGAKASDVAVREAIYNQTLKETGDRALAELRAREIINFSRRGASRTADYLIRTIPFFNAYARSMDKLLLAAAGNPSAQRSIGATTGYARNLFYKRMGVMTAMGFGYAVMMSDDEEYQNLPDYVRDRNWILPGGKELGFVPAVPLPAELSFFFKAIPERVVQYFKLEGTPEERDAMRVLKELMLNGVDLFWAPNLTPQMVKPIVENLANYSFFLGRPLESQAQLALDPSERYGTGTSEAMKAASRTLTDIATSTGIESLKVSPIMLENLVRGMFGMSAGIALSVADVMVNPTRTDRPLHQTIAAQLTGASAVMKDPVGMRYLDEIYNLDRSVEQVYNSYNRKLKNNPDDAEKFLKDNFGLYVVRSEVRSTMEAIRALNAQARAIDKMTDLSPQERRVIINDLRAQQNDLARDVYRLRRQVTEEQRMMDASR